MLDYDALPITESADSPEERIEALEQTLSILRGAINASWVGFTLADGYGNNLMVNPSFTRITGLPPESIVGRNYSVIQSENRNKSCTMQVLARGGPVKMEQMPLSGRKYMTYGNLYFDQKSNKKYVVCNCIDDIELNLTKQAIEVAQNTTRESELVQSLPLEILQNTIIYSSPEMETAIQLCSTIAPFDSTVMLEGESGTGKELLADYIVAQSKRSQKPFIKINCAAIPDTLLESELFGYEANAFTGANPKGKRGIFELAHEGTVMLDEIGELSLPLQSKLLRFLQEKDFYHIGGLAPINVDVRIIVATNQNLFSLVEEGLFRADLYYRLSVVPILVPPLRKRTEDIPLLIRFFLEKYNRQYQLKRQFSNDIIDYLKHRQYAGNVRELQNYVERIVLLAPKDLISLSDVLHILGVSLKSTEEKKDNAITLKALLEEYEKNILVNSLQEHGTAAKICQALDISQPTLSRKLAYYGLTIAGAK